MKISKQSLNKYYGHAFLLTNLLAEEQTKYQKMEIYETQTMGKLLMLDNITQLCESLEYYYHEPMSHIPLLEHPNPKKVLIIGGGDGGILREVCKYKTLDKIIHVELDPEVVEFSKKYLPSISNGAWSDPRVELVILDGKQYIDETDEKFDVIIMDMTDPIGPSVDLYRQPFFQVLKTKLSDNGVFNMHASSPFLTPNLYGDICTTLSSVFKYVHPFYIYIQMYGSLFAIPICSDYPINIHESSIASALSKYKLHDLKLITPQSMKSMSVDYPDFLKLRQSGNIISAQGLEPFKEFEQLIFNNVVQ